jgi:hypothetical protein
MNRKKKKNIIRNLYQNFKKKKIIRNLYQNFFYDLSFRRRHLLVMVGLIIHIDIINKTPFFPHTHTPLQADLYVLAIIGSKSNNDSLKGILRYV